MMSSLVSWYPHTSFSRFSGTLTILFREKALTQHSLWAPVFSPWCFLLSYSFMSIKSKTATTKNLWLSCWMPLNLEKHVVRILSDLLMWTSSEHGTQALGSSNLFPLLFFSIHSFSFLLFSFRFVFLFFFSSFFLYANFVAFGKGSWSSQLYLLLQHKVKWLFLTRAINLETSLS